MPDTIEGMRKTLTSVPASQLAMFATDDDLRKLVLSVHPNATEEQIQSAMPKLKEALKKL